MWVGFDTPKSLGNREFGSTTALPIWVDFVERNIDSIPKDETLIPSGLVSVKIDESSGKRAAEGGKNTIFEYYLEEFVPK